MVRRKKRYPYVVDGEGTDERLRVSAMPIPDLARATVGFGYRELRDLICYAHEHGEWVTAASVLAQRTEILNRAFGDLFEVIAPTHGFDGIVGYEELKRDLRVVRDAMLAGDVKRFPRGILLMGPPGTGKTVLARALAKECDILLLKVKNLRGQWVGVTEQNYERMVHALLDLAPVIVFRDEVDQEDTGRDTPQGDAGVSARARQKWMEFLSDEKIIGRVLVISATNRPDLLDPALKRTGRMDRKYPMLMPDPAQCEALLTFFPKKWKYPCTVTDFAPYAARVHAQWLSGSDVEGIVRSAYDESCHRGAPGVSDETLAWAIEDFRPSRSRREVAQMTLVAIDETSSTRLLPKDWEAQRAKAIAILNGTDGVPGRPLIPRPTTDEFVVDPKMVGNK